MSGTLTHSPADVIRQVLEDLSVSVAPGSHSATDWVSFYSVEPDIQDRIITSHDTTGIAQGRTHVDGQLQEFHGVQVMVRAEAYEVAYNKAQAVAVALDTNIQLTYAEVESQGYTVYSFNRTSPVISLGREAPSTRRSIFTINGLVSLIQT
jgi:hypothetical protein